MKTKWWPAFLAAGGGLAALLIAHRLARYGCNGDLLREASTGKIVFSCAEFWLNRYQTLIGAVVAGITLVFLVRQIRLTSAQANAAAAQTVKSIISDWDKDREALKAIVRSLDKSYIAGGEDHFEFRSQVRHWIHVLANSTPGYRKACYDFEEIARRNRAPAIFRHSQFCRDYFEEFTGACVDLDDFANREKIGEVEAKLTDEQRMEVFSLINRALACRLAMIEELRRARMHVEGETEAAHVTLRDFEIATIGRWWLRRPTV
jgi:anti-sigma-K factor RskA